MNALGEIMNILVLSPHADDSELGAGGTIARFVEEGMSVHCMVFSAPSQRRQEAESAMRVLGVDRLDILDFETRRFPEQRQDILQEMIDLRRRNMPDLVICPARNDIHQDHQVVAAEAVRAFKYCSVLGYEQPWNNLAFATRLFVRLEQRHIDSKVHALACHESQRSGLYMEPDFISGLATTRGMQIKHIYAEAFGVLRWII